MQNTIGFTPLQLSGEELIDELVVLLRSLASSRSGETTPTDVQDGEIWTKTMPTGERYAMLHYGSTDTAIAKITAQGQLFIDAGELSGTVPAARLSGDYAINITGNAATATSANSATSASTAGACSGNAATASKLLNARTIGGVTFDGSANISLPGVNTTGNQSTTGNAATASSCSGNSATATTLSSAKTIAIGTGATGTATIFNGSADITIPITAINASYLASGIIPSARLSGDYAINITGNAATATSANSAASASTAGACSGNAATASKILNARTIGGVSFDGSASINLPGVNTTGNQSTTGNAATASSCSGNSATATTLSSAKTIAIGTGATGTATVFNGSADITIPITAINADYMTSGIIPSARLSGDYGINITGNAATATSANSAASASTAGACSGNAATASKLLNARTIGGVSFDGSASINLPGVNTTGNQSTTGNAATSSSCSGNSATASKLQSTLFIALSGAATGTATSFDGSGNITIPVTALNASNLSSGTVPAARLPLATTSALGAMSASDKIKVDSLKSQWIGPESSLPSSKDTNTIYYAY